APHSILLNHHRLAKCQWLGAAYVRSVVYFILRGEPFRKIELAPPAVRSFDDCPSCCHHGTRREDSSAGDWLRTADPRADDPSSCRCRVGDGLAPSPQSRHPFDEY